MSTFEFEEFPKIARLSRGCVITEKIDGTNAQVHIESRATFQNGFPPVPVVVAANDTHVMLAGSRSRYITPAADNFGFAAWVQANANVLWSLGEGRHHGEWWGSGIQRGYGLPKGEQRFSLFNVARWHAVGGTPFESKPGDPRLPSKFSTEAPACCCVVPVLHAGAFDTDAALAVLSALAEHGSRAAPGFMRPEGIVVWHEAARVLFKKTLEKDEEPKGPRR